MGLIEILTGRGRKATPPVPPPPPGSEVSVSVVHDLSEELTPESPAWGASGLALMIRYNDARGRASQRRISVISVGPGEDCFLLRAYCHERRAPRSFRSERIVEAIDMATGEVIEDMTAWLVDGAGEPSTPRQALQAAHDGLIVLTFLAKCDGKLHAAEMDVAREFVMEYDGGEGVDPEMLERHMLRMWPDLESYEEAIDRLADRGDELVLTAGFGLELIGADGKVTPEEAEFAEMLREAVPGDFRRVGDLGTPPR